MSNQSKTFKMICYIDDFEAWDHTINEHACKFFGTYSIYPNILLASKETWGKIDEYANLFNPGNIKPSDEFVEEPDQDDTVKSISCFVTSEYSLEFCLDEKVGADYFILIFDEDPTFDGEPIDDEEDAVIYRRIA